MAESARSPAGREILRVTREILRVAREIGEIASSAPPAVRPRRPAAGGPTGEIASSALPAVVWRCRPLPDPGNRCVNGGGV